MADDIIHYVTLMANHISRMRTFPYLDGVHNIVMCLLVREGDKENCFAKQHVFGSWFLSILMCFSGSVVSNFLAGEPVSTPFKYLENVILASAIWYLVNYFPRDAPYRFFKLPMVEVVLSCIWSIYLVNKIQSGVSYGIKHFPDAYIIATVLGLAKGCGDRYMIALIKLVKGTFKETDNPILFVPEQTKCSLVSSILFVLSHYYQLPAYNQPFVFMGSLLLFIHTTVTQAAFGGSGMFSPFEQLVCGLLFSWGPREVRPLVRLPPESEEKTFYSHATHNSRHLVEETSSEALYDEIVEVGQPTSS